MGLLLEETHCTLRSLGFEYLGGHSALQRQLNYRFATFSFDPIVQRNVSAMSLCDLAAEGQADSRSTGFRGEEGHE